MKFYAYHGVHAEEREKGGWYEVDVRIQWQPDARGLAADKLEATVDYENVYRQVHQVMQEPVALVERLALLLHDRLAALMPDGTGLTVRVRKLLPPVDGEMQYAEFVWQGS